ncbi:hypothetical protein OG2516_10736 [Oceanicola granulosus HTCC2516]|uniref:UPF0246 protein OG2516_10736 n=1 Tax=Oceanicola granulosus (strain ATCC BAA-861 / DSM 15982 / KCTC 12143 / HTCC2516) TaxID=314256 RepID=Q2CK56_OCEGH|nr:peroxide stress protein YaaA [Oceanicola granulosus]EAR52933.1 hypothetical protein OG2516_10736 [Oceanicola granulosus HTCC2516]
MLTVISPAKSLDESPVAVTPTEPAFAADALRLAKSARNLTLGELKRLMSISDDLARLNRDRFRAFKAEPGDGDVKPAALLFDGDVYQGLHFASLDAAARDWAQARLRILSGLYGLLRPLDGIQPYRLEMGTRLKTRRGTSLYAYWGDQVAKALNAEAEAAGTDVLLNCASQEYFGVAERKALKLRVVTPRFLEARDGERKMISFYAKHARGALARWVIEHRVSDPGELDRFDSGGYAYDAEASAPDAPVFVRQQPG